MSKRTRSLPKPLRAIPDLGKAKGRKVKRVLQGVAYYARKARRARYVADGSH